MLLEFALKVFISILPVLAFLLILFQLDSHKLIGKLFTVSMIFVGGMMGIFSFYLNSHLMELLSLDYREYTFYAAPATEEFIKGMVVLYLILSKRIGFLVDSIILGFAVGSGFAIVENLYYFFNNSDIHLGVWIIRGFGTAIMHSGATALFALIIQEKFVRKSGLKFLNVIVAFFAAFALHATFNHYPSSIMMSIIMPLLVIPFLFFYVINKNSKSIDSFLKHDYDKHRRLLELIDGSIPNAEDAQFGQFIHDIRDIYPPKISEALIRYIRLHTELILSAELFLSNQENTSDELNIETVETKIREMHRLETSLGKVPLYFVHEHLHFSSKDFWMIHMLDEMAFDHKMLAT